MVCSKNIVSIHLLAKNGVVLCGDSETSRESGNQASARFRKLSSRDLGNGDSENHAIQETESARFRKRRDSGT